MKLKTKTATYMLQKEPTESKDSKWHDAEKSNLMLSITALR